MAQFRAGDPTAAIEALSRSVEFEGTCGAPNGFFLAMAYWQLGEEEKARQHYSKAVEWMENNKDLYEVGEERDRFRAEAAELLGMTEGPQTEDDPQPSAEKETPEKEDTTENTEHTEKSGPSGSGERERVRRRRYTAKPSGYAEGVSQRSPGSRSAPWVTVEPDDANPNGQRRL